MLAIYTEACKHAVAALTLLARFRRDEWVPLQSILDAGDFPPASLAKVLQRLSAAGILRSARGPGGGFQLAKVPVQVRLADIVVAVDGSDRLGMCALGTNSCAETDWCPLHPSWSAIKTSVSEMLQRTTLEDLARVASARRPSAGRKARGRNSRRTLPAVRRRT